MVIDVELLVTDTCLHLDAAIDVIAAAAAILVAGVDVSPDPEAVGGVLACRVYRTGHRVSGTPDVDLVRTALRAAIRP